MQTRYTPRMQTFLPYPDFDQTTSVLDYRRLGKQRVEAMQILRSITDGNRPGWRNHPCVKMWEGYPDALAAYMNACITEWVRRGYRNTMPLYALPSKIMFPHWLGNPAFHSAHRAALLFKDPAHYSQFNWSETPQIAYIWPTETKTAQST